MLITFSLMLVYFSFSFCSYLYLRLTCSPNELYGL